MKLEINVDMNDRNLEYTQGPTGFLEEPPESTVVINIKNNPGTEDLDYQVDLENGVLNYGTYVATLSSDFISAFKTSRANGSMRIGTVNGNYNAGSNNYYTYLKECIIEY